MPRSIWKGAISFGLVTIPVKLYSATEERDVSFHQVHREDGGRIKYKRVCTVDGEEVEFSEGFTDLHTRSYEEIVAGRGFRLDEVRPSIDIVSTFRTTPLVRSNGVHAFAQKAMHK